MKVELWDHYTSYSPCIMKLSKNDEGPIMVYAQIQQEITRKKKANFSSLHERLGLACMGGERKL